MVSTNYDIKRHDWRHEMELIKKGDSYIAKCDFSEKDIAKKAGFRWNPENKIWFTKDEVIAMNLKKYAKEDVFSESEINKKVEASFKASTNAELKKPNGIDYFQFQKAGIEFGIIRKNVLIADDMGLGKTIQAIGILNQLDTFGTVLIVCPKTPVLNWKAELEKWLIQKKEIVICNSKTEIIDNGNIYIINYDILSKVEMSNIDVLIADEVHYAKNKKAARSKAFYGIEANKRIYLTGTPIMNRPSELFHIVKSLDDSLFGNEYSFWKRYCDLKGNGYGLDYSGSSNEEELNLKLRSSVMIRRMKTEVLKDLPEKIRQVIKFEGNQKLIQKEMQLFRQAKKESIDTGSIGEIITLRKEIALKKLPQVIEYIKDTLENEEKIIVFAHHKEVIVELEQELNEYGLVKIDGSVSQDDRQNAVKEFQNGKARVFIGSIRACSEAITLTASSHVIFAEIDWTPGKNQQAEDRAYRIGQKNTVNITYLVYENSVDEYILNQNILKEETIDKIVN